VKNDKENFFKELFHIIKVDDIPESNERVANIELLIMKYKNLMDDECELEERFTKAERSYYLKLMSDYLLADVLRSKKKSKSKGVEYSILSKMQQKRRRRVELSIPAVHSTNIKKRRERNETYWN